MLGTPSAKERLKRSLIKVVFIGAGQSPRECHIDTQQFITGLTKAELTTREFQDHFMSHLIRALQKEHSLALSPAKLQLFDLKGLAVESILDWMQRPEEAQLADFTLLCKEQTTSVREALKYFARQNLMAENSSELEDILRPIQEVLDCMRVSEASHADSQDSFRLQQSQAQNINGLKRQDKLALKTNQAADTRSSHERSQLEDSIFSNKQYFALDSQIAPCNTSRFSD